MSPAEFEQYQFYRLYSIDFDSVLHSISVLKRYRRQDVRNCLLREIVVSYARPFSGNRGTVLGKHVLKTTFVPREMRALHAELLNLRMRQFAHTDHTHYRPKVAKWPGKERPIFPMSFKGYDYASLNRRIGEIERLVRSVASQVDGKLRELENDL